MTTDLDLNNRLTRVGDHLDDLARRANADAYDPINLHRQPARPSGPRPLIFAAAVVVATVALAGAAIALGRDGPGSVATTDRPTDQAAKTALSESELLGAHPVLGQAIADTCEPGWVPSAFGACFLLGPAGFTRLDVTEARAADQDGTWGVAVRVTESARPVANRMFNACFAASAACPEVLGSTGHGAVAFVSKGRVIAVPTIQAASLADDEMLVLPGGLGADDTGLTRREAETLAAALS